MAKIKLGAHPTVLARTVKFTLPDGSAAQIECGFVYRTRTEFGALIDGLAAAVSDDTAPEKFSMAAVLERSSEANADYLLQILKTWDVDAELNRASLEQLADELPAAVVALMDAYRGACVEGRAGN